MKYPEFSVGLEKMRIPVLVSDGEGVVLYKNASAMQHIRLPKRMTKIGPHLYHGPELSTILKGVSPRLSKRVSIDTGERVMNAIVSAHGQNKDQYIWIFPPVMQNSPCSADYTLFEKRLLDCTYEICDVVRCASLLDQKSTDKAPDALNARIDRRVDVILDALFARFENEDPGTLHGAYKTVLMLSDTFPRTLSRLGYPVRSDCSSLDKEKMKSSHANALMLSLLLSHASRIALDSSGQNGLSVRFTSTAEILGIDLVYTGLYPPFYTNDSASFSDFTRLSGGRTLIHEVLSHICESSGCKFRFAVSADEIDNVKLHFDFPLVVRPGLHTPGTVSDLFFERDCALYLVSLFE